MNYPRKLSWSPVYTIQSVDIDDDGDQDLFLGEFVQSQPEVGIYDASYGTYLENKATEPFRPLRTSKGFLLKEKCATSKSLTKPYLYLETTILLLHLNFKS